MDFLLTQTNEINFQMLYFFLDGNEKGIFRICEKTGKIHLDRSVASAAGTTFTLTVKVTDGDFCSSAVLKILITSSC